MQTGQTSSLSGPAVGIGGIAFNRHGQVLLIKRGQPPARGLWSIPGGKQETGESMVEACKREFREETGLTVEVRKIVAVVERRIENFHYIIIDFFVELLDQGLVSPVAQGDVTEARWVDVARIGDYPLVEGLDEIIRRSHRMNQSGVGLLDIDSKATDFVLSG